ncbi:LOW QUALITY PROTEIN: hypothetical protein HID58_078120 [Brassica napus]|uniref:Uncharacterized protein n=1 Tax=Brassica napus TaxID=3708 RepID=A0ABQ7YSA4_BRANA|nr:LOW QUALITY PROTEIN: hypothetical protein HID58_078120 [Brassica napus]
MKTNFYYTACPPIMNENRDGSGVKSVMNALMNVTIAPVTRLYTAFQEAGEEIMGMPAKDLRSTGSGFWSVESIL